MKKYLMLAAFGILNGIIPFLLFLLINDDLRYLFVSPTELEEN